MLGFRVGPLENTESIHPQIVYSEAPSHRDCISNCFREILDAKALFSRGQVPGCRTVTSQRGSRICWAPAITQGNIPVMFGGWRIQGAVPSQLNKANFTAMTFLDVYES